MADCRFEATSSASVGHSFQHLLPGIYPLGYNLTAFSAQRRAPSDNLSQASQCLEPKDSST